MLNPTFEGYQWFAEIFLFCVANNHQNIKKNAPDNQLFKNAKNIVVTTQIKKPL